MRGLASALSGAEFDAAIALFAKAPGGFAPNATGWTQRGGEIWAQVRQANGAFVPSRIITAAGALVDAAKGVSQSISALSSVASVAKFAGPYGAALKATMPLIDMVAGGLFGGSSEPPKPSIDGLSSTALANAIQNLTWGNREAELAGRLLADRTQVGGTGDIDGLRTAVSTWFLGDAGHLNKVLIAADAAGSIAPHEHRQLAIMLAQAPPELVVKDWLKNKRFLPYLMQLVAYGTPRAALRKAMGSLGLLLSAEAAEAWTWGVPVRDRAGNQNWIAPRGPRDDERCSRPGLPRGVPRGGRFRFVGRLSKWIGTAGHSAGHDAKWLCENGADIYAAAVARQVLPGTHDSDSDAAGRVAVYPVTEDDARAEMAYYATHAARIYRTVGDRVFVFGFPASGRTASSGEREPGIDNDTVRPLPSASEAIEIIFRIATTVAVGGTTLLSTANASIRGLEEDIKAQREANEAAARAVVAALRRRQGRATEREVDVAKTNATRAVARRLAASKSFRAAVKKHEAAMKVASGKPTVAPWVKAAAAAAVALLALKA